MCCSSTPRRRVRRRTRPRPPRTPSPRTCAAGSGPRRLKARVERERLPRGADPNTHTKLGRGGLADVEWAVQLVQLRHAYAAPELRLTRTLEALWAERDAGLIGRADAQAMTAGWTLAARVRNALTLVRGRPTDQLPQHGVELAGAVQLLGGGDPGEVVDTY